MEDFIPPFLQLDFQITGRCNSRCMFCNCWKNPYPSEKDIPAEVWVETAKRLLGFTDIEYLCIGGGEPLLYRDIFKVLRSMTNLNIHTIMVTNGSLFTHDTCFRILDSGLNQIDFSIDGLEKMHDGLRGTPGLFKKCIESIFRLKKMDPRIRLGISSLICGKNIHELPKFLDWALRELPIDSINFQAYQQVTEYKGNRWWEKSALWPSDQEAVIHSLDYLAEKSQSEKKITNHPIQCEKFKRYFFDPKNNLGIDCPAGAFNFSVSHTGDVVGCIAMGPVGNINCEDPVNIYRKKFPDVRKKASVCDENCHFLINCYFPLHWSKWEHLVKDMVKEDTEPIYKPGPVVLPPEIRDITKTGDYADLIRYDAHKHLDTIETINNPDTRVLPVPHPEHIPCIYLCGHTSEVHRWAVNLDEQDFFKQINLLKQVISKGEHHHIIVGVTRTNFHRLNKICHTIRELKHFPLTASIPDFSVTPLKGIKERFYNYFGKLKTIGQAKGIEFRIVDQRFDEFLSTVESETEKSYYIEHDLLRALGPVSKDVFFGPKHILLDLSGKCNLDCVYCRGFSDWNREFIHSKPESITRFMDLSIIRNTLQEAKEIGVECVLLVGGGEPTFHPNFLEIIGLIKEIGLKFNFSTNGTLLDRFNAYLLDGSCESVTVSLSFASEGTFERLRPGSNPELANKIEKAVRHLSSMKRAKGAVIPHIVVLFAICDYNCHEIVPFVKSAKEMGANSIWYQMVHLEDFSQEELAVSPEKMKQVREDLKTAKQLCEQNGIDFSSFIDFEMECFDERAGDWSKGGMLEQGCFVGWHFSFVFLRGEIYFCCGARTVGYLNNDGKGFRDSWFSDTYRRYRNDGLILQKENPISLNGKTLYDKYCNSCDNHDQNNMMIELLKIYELLPFVERFIPRLEKPLLLEPLNDKSEEDLVSAFEDQNRNIGSTQFSSGKFGLKKHHYRPGIDILLVVTPPWGVGNPHIGIAYLSSYLRKKAFIVHTYDMNIEMFNHVKQDLKKYWNVENYSQWGTETSMSKLISILSNEIDIAIGEVLKHQTKAIGFTSTYSNLQFVLYLAKRLRKYRPDIKIIIGGPGTNSETSRTAIVKTGNVDCIVVGEGEVRLEEYLSHLRSTKKSSDAIAMPGLMVKGDNGFNLFRTGHQNERIDDYYYPDFYGLNLNSYAEESLPIIFSRGCKGKCSFCEISLLWHTFRSRTPQAILEEFEFHVKHNNVHKFRNFDSAINQSSDVLDAVVDGIIRRKLNIEWDGSFVARKGLKKHFFNKLYSSGCKTLYFGLESGSEKILHLMRKPFRVEWVQDNIRYASDAGIKVFLNIIVGFPGETEADFEKTLSFITKNRDFIHSIGGATALQLVEDTYLFKHSDNYDIRVSEKDFNYRWETNDGKNTLEIRENRLVDLLQLLNRLHIGSPVCASLHDGQDTVKINGKDSYFEREEIDLMNRNIDLLLISAPPWDVETPPFNLFYLKSYLNSKRFATEVYDLNIELYNRGLEHHKEYWKFENSHYWLDSAFIDHFIHEERHIIDRLLEEIVSIDADIIGFSMIEQKILFFHRFITDLNARDHNAKIIIGGPSCFDTESVETIANRFQGLVDGYVLKEGEITLEEILRKKRNSENFDGIGGFYVPESSDTFAYRDMIRDLDHLPFADYCEVEFGKYQSRALALSWSRGCIGNCTFCNVRRMWGRFRYRSVDSIIKEMRYHIEENNIRDFVIYDSLINFNIRELNRVCDTIVREGLDISWYALAVPRNNMTETLFKKLRKAGCFRLEFGIESGSYRVLKDMKKIFDPEIAALNLKMAHDAGIECGICLIAGYPTEREADFEDTLQFLARNRKYIGKVSQVNALCILNGTYLHDNHRDYDITFPSDNPVLLWTSPENTYDVRKKRVSRIENKIGELEIHFVKSNLTDDGNICSEQISDEVTKDAASEVLNWPAPIPIILSICPPWGIDHPPISLGYLASYLKRANIKHRIFDLNIKLYELNSKKYQKTLWHVENDYMWRITPIKETMAALDGIDDLVNELANFDSPMIGFSLIDPNQYISCEVIKKLKAISPHKITIVGGPVCATSDERIWLRSKTDNLIDFMVVGEGEKPLLELIKQINGRAKNGEIVIPNVVDCRHSENMELKSTYELVDLAELSFPDYAGFPLDAYSSQVAAVMWSRGCVSNCTFCKEKSLWDRHRTRPIDDILEEIKFYKQKNISEFVIYDSLVNGTPSHLERLCDRIISEDLNIRWSALAIPERSLTKRLLEKMKLAGCFVLIFGLESGSEKVLKRMRKRFLLKDAIETIKNTRHVGIESAINIIVGFPGEDEEEFNKTIDFIQKYNNYIDRVDAVTPLQLVRGTYLFNHYEKFNITLPQEREHEYWSTVDGTNTYEIRMERRQKVLETCNRHGIEIRKGFNGKNCGNDRKPKRISKDQYGIEMLFVDPAHNEIPDYATASILEYLSQNNISAAYLAGNGYAESDEDLLTKFGRFDAKFLAVKTSVEQRGNSLDIVEKARNTNKYSRIILWGPGCRTESQRKGLPPNLVDAIIFQEYEKAFKELVIRSRNGRFDPCIPGIYVPGKPFIPLSPIRDLAKYPFPRYKEFDLNTLKIHVLPLRLSSGCPHRCSFCSIYHEEGPFRIRSPQIVYEEMLYHLETNGISEYVFQDRAINGNLNTLHKLCEIIGGDKNPVTWKAKYVVQNGDNDFLFQEMAAAGCTHLNFGFVSGSDHVLKLMGKPFDVRALKNALRKTAETEIRTIVRLMVGFPGESETDFWDTLTFLFNNKEYIDEIDMVSPCYIQSGSDLEMAPEQYCIILPRTNRWREWHDGSYNNFSYRLKKSKEIAIFLKELGILSALPNYVKEDDEILTNRDQIFDRYSHCATNSSEDSLPKTLKAASSAFVDDPVAKGIFSNTLTFAAPETLEIDLTNNCNLSCIGCWCHSPLLGEHKFTGYKKKKCLPKKTILALLKDARRLGGHTTVQLAGAGEPFLHPDIWEVIEAVKKYGMGCGIITNFTLLENEDIRRLVDLGVDSITASIWAGDEETYCRTHPGTPALMFEQLKKNLSLLTESRESEFLPNLKIYHVVNAENANNINSMVDFAIQLGADAVELTMVDVVPGKTDGLRPDLLTQELILSQFNDLRLRPDYTSEFIRTKHLDPFDNKMFYEELKEFGRIYPVLREGFSYDPDYNSIRCSLDKKSILKDISFNNSSATFAFDRHDCEQCAKRKDCWTEGTQMGTIRVRPMTILGAGSFLRRLTSSKREIQEYELKIIDRIPCTVGWTYARINVDGNVIPCCKASDFSLGNLHEDSFSSIWQSADYSEFRQKAKELSKKDPYFSRINCYKSCDNLGMNLHTYLRLLNYIKK